MPYVARPIFPNRGYPCPATLMALGSLLLIGGRILLMFMGSMLGYIDFLRFALATASLFSTVALLALSIAGLAMARSE